MRTSALLLAIFLLLLPACSADKAPSFSDTWDDGNAELSGYKLTFPRNDQHREGTLVTIFATEQFSKKERVKTDKGQAHTSDIMSVIKLNLIKNFRTGINDYHMMTSVFAAVDRFQDRAPGAPLKVSFSAQEWNGSQYAELLFYGNNRMSYDLSSYFFGESLQEKPMPYPANGITEDQLPMVVRGMPQPVIEPGQSKQVQFLPSLERAALSHDELSWQHAMLSMDARTHTVAVPAGRFKAHRYTLTSSTGPNLEFFVETALPHRIVQYKADDGERWELKATKRMPYWELNNNGDERYLDELGLGNR